MTKPILGTVIWVATFYLPCLLSRTILHLYATILLISVIDLGRRGNLGRCGGLCTGQGMDRVAASGHHRQPDSGRHVASLQLLIHRSRSCLPAGPQFVNMNQPQFRKRRYKPQPFAGDATNKSESVRRFSLTSSLSHEWHTSSHVCA